MNSTVFEMIIRVFGAFLSIYSFAVLLQVPRRFVLQAGIVGAIGGFVQAFPKSEWKQNSMKYVRKIVPGAEEPQNTEKREK